MNNTTPSYKKLIEVAMPIKEVSAESVRDKSIRHGHISTLHLWWARRPLPVCRAVVFASLVPDPDDSNCPSAFREAVELILGKSAGISGDPYLPYDDIPYTSAVDRLDDTPRNRLLMFVGKFSDTFARNEKAGRVTASKDMINVHSLVRWESKNDEAIIGRARRLIWVAHNATQGKSATTLLQDFDKDYKAILAAENDLYSTPDRHLAAEEVQAKENHLHEALEIFLDKMPRVFDPFAGGGAIPLEAARLGCRSFGNDINPVAHIIQRGSLEFPQRFGKPIVYSKHEFKSLYGSDALDKYYKHNNFLGEKQDIISIPNRLAYDVDYFARKMIAESAKSVDANYPADSNGKKPLAYYWVRFAACSNPSCRAQVPLLKSFYLSTKRNSAKTSWVYLNPVIVGTDVSFEIKYGECEIDGWVHNRKNLKCPCCNNITTNKELKNQFLSGNIKEKIIAVIKENPLGKEFAIPSAEDMIALDSISSNKERMSEKLPFGNTKQFDLCPWGFLSYGQLFNDRQYSTLESLVESLNTIKKQLEGRNVDYNNAIVTYLAILIDRVVARNTSFGRWHTHQDTIEHPFSRQAIPMTFDYPEMNPFSNFSGGILSQLQYVTDVIREESPAVFFSECKNATSGDLSQFPKKYLTCSITDPPYFDAIAYADVSDIFYVWLKKSLFDVYPMNFGFPQTPKTEECTALKHYHGGNVTKANTHFESKLNQIFKAIEFQTSDLVSIMFAHQSTEAWTTLCNSVLKSKLNITGSWAIDTEMKGRMVAIGNAALESSVTVSCRPSQRSGYGSYKDVKREIEKTVQREVEELYRLGFRGADLLTACFGQAVSVFGKYEYVEKADGSEVSVSELLELARESAFIALLKGFDGDEPTKFYIAWLQLYGFGEADFDDAAKFSRVGLTINVADLVSEHLFLKKGNKLTLAGFADRVLATKTLGETKQSRLIDQIHRALALYKAGNRQQLLIYIGKYAATSELPFWRVLTALVEVLPAGSDDQKQAVGLLADKESVLRESTQLAQQRPSLIQGQFELS
jgi:putative DNA methylase